MNNENKTFAVLIALIFMIGIPLMAWNHYLATTYETADEALRVEWDGQISSLDACFITVVDDSGLKFWHIARGSTNIPCLRANRRIHLATSLATRATASAPSCGIRGLKGHG